MKTSVVGKIINGIEQGIDQYKLGLQEQRAIVEK
jgi:hypothetical protein